MTTPDAHGWMTIENAPSKGRVWVFGGRHSEPTVVKADGQWWRTEGLMGTPTHWQPIPKPPVRA